MLHVEPTLKVLEKESVIPIDINTQFSWSWLWTHYKGCKNPIPKSGNKFTNHLISTYGSDFKYCLNKKTTENLKKLFELNITSTAEKNN